MVATIGDLNSILCSGFQDVQANGHLIVLSPDKVDVRYCHGSYAVGGPLVDATAVVEDTWYRVSCPNYVKELKACSETHDDLQ
eukprot:999008-Pyramimonas_sp.AAC.1